MRSRERQVVNGERPSAYFCASEKKNKNNKSTITEVLENDKPTTTEPTNILKQCHEYYTNLFDETLQDRFLRNIDKKLSASAKRRLDSAIADEKVKQAIDLGNENSSPGLDSLLIEFYHHFYSKLKPSPPS